MRATQGSVQRYTPAPIPDNNDALIGYLRQELDKLSATLDAVAGGQFDVTTVAPTKPRAGMIRFADGTSWNPGGGVGFYGYNGTSWTKF